MLMKHLRLLVLLLWPYCFSSAHAQIFADLSLSVRIEPPYPWIPGTEGRQVFTATNNSDQIVRGQLRLLNRGEAPPDLDLFEFLGRTCQTDLLCEGFGNFCYNLGTLVPGQTRSCESRARAVERRQRRLEVAWLLRDAIFGTTDPNPSDNTVRYTPEVAGAAIITQVPTSPWAYALMSVLILGVGAATARRFS